MSLKTRAVQFLSDFMMSIILLWSWATTGIQWKEKKITLQKYCKLSTIIGQDMNIQLVFKAKKTFESSIVYGNSIESSGTRVFNRLHSLIWVSIRNMEKWI